MTPATREDRYERRYVRNDDDPTSNEKAPKPGDTTHHDDDRRQVQGKRPAVDPRKSKATGPGVADEQSAPGRPKTTGTPGGQLGAATPSELDRDHAETSDKAS